MRPILYPFLFISFLSNAQWVSVSPGGSTEYEAVLVDDAQHFLIAGDGTGKRTSDGGTTWTPIADLDGEALRDLHRLDAQVILGTGSTDILRSADNGDTWTVIGTAAPDDLHAFASAGNMVIAVGRDGGIVRSEDAGLTWSIQNSGTSERLFTAWAISATDLLAAGKDGVYLRSSDGGITWVPGTLPTTDDWTGVHFFSDPSIGLLCGEDGNMLRTTDGGDTWMEIATGSAMGFTGLASAHDSVVYASGASGGVLKSNDLGLTWIDTNSPATDELANMHVSNGMAVAVGAGATVIKLGNVTSGLLVNAMTAGQAALLYPNPTSVHIQLRRNGTMRSGLLAEVISMHGTVVHTQPLSGTNPLLDVSGLAGGTYTVRISDDATLVCQEKVVVQR